MTKSMKTAGGQAEQAKQGNWGRWGDGDQLGTLNFITPEMIARAAGLVRRGKVIPLSIPLKADAPRWPGRHENWHVAMHMNLCGPGLGGAEDILMIHTHGTTHMDALCHIVHDGKMYNGFDAAGSIDSLGAKRNAIDNVGAIVTRGLLVDIAGARGVDHLPADAVITPEETERILAGNGHEAREGDALLFRTGWLRTWEKAKDAVLVRQPGIGLELARWAGAKGVAVIAADNSAVEAFPVAGDFLPVHREFLWNQGGYLMELLDLDALAADGSEEFMFVAAPLRIVKGLGSPLTPLAIR